MKKKALAAILAVILLLPLLVIPASADFISDTVEWIKGKVTPFLDVINVITNITKIKLFDVYNAQKTIYSGGYNYAGALNGMIENLYQIFYPIGFAVLLLSWCFNIAKSGLSCSIDIKEKTSIFRAVLSFVVGIVAITVSPMVLTWLSGASNWLYQAIYTSNVSFGNIFNIGGNTTLLGIIATSRNNTVYYTIVLLVVDLIFMLNMVWLAFLQAASPLFVAFIGNESTRRLAAGFVKEYFKALLVPPVTIAYLSLCISLFGGMVAEGAVIGLIAAIVLAISTLGIAGKKLDKLIS